MRSPPSGTKLGAKVRVARERSRALIAGVNEAALERFVAACKEDTRVVAAFLGGSHAAGTADEYSDLDLCLIVDDQNYDTFFAERRAFLGRLGDAVFFEDFSVGLVGYKNLEQAADARDLESLRETLCPRWSGRPCSKPLVVWLGSTYAQPRRSPPSMG
jgi:predicted nucleotidyltransferase